MWGLVPKKVDEDLAFFDALLAHLVRTQPVDPDRVFLAGMSNGAYFAHLTAQKRSTKVAGAIAHSGGMDLGAMVLGVNAKVKFPVLIIHGAEDRLLKAEDAKKARDLYTKEGHPVEYVEVPKLGHAWATEIKVNDKIAAFIKDPPKK
jgi:polyhydroxybutyrate depolymerase